MDIDVLNILLRLIDVDERCSVIYKNYFVNDKSQHSELLWISKLLKKMELAFCIFFDDDGFAEIRMNKIGQCTYSMKDLTFPEHNKLYKNIASITKSVVNQTYNVQDLIVKNLNRKFRHGDSVRIDIPLLFSIHSFSEPMVSNRVLSLDGNILCSNILGKIIPESKCYALNSDECQAVCKSFVRAFKRVGGMLKSQFVKRNRVPIIYSHLDNCTKEAFMAEAMGKGPKDRLLSDKYQEYYRICKILPTTILAGSGEASDKEAIYKSVRENIMMKDSFETWAADFLNVYETSSVIELKDSMETMVKSIGMQPTDITDTIQTIICLCKIFYSPNSISLSEQVYKMTLDEEFNGVIWPEESLKTLEELTKKINVYKMRYNSRDLFNLLELMSSEKNLENLITHSYRFKGILGEMLGIESIKKTEKDHYTDEHEKKNLKQIIAECIDKIKKPGLDDLLGTNVVRSRSKMKLIDQLISKIPSINQSMEKRPDFCRLENRGESQILIIYEICWRSSKQGREAKRILDRGKWEPFVVAMSKYLRVEVNVMTLTDEDVQRHIANNKGRDKVAAIAELFLKLNSRIVNTKRRTKMMNELENEQEQMRLRKQQAIKNKSIMIEEESTVRNFIETVQAKDNTNPTSLLFPEGIHEQMWKHMHTNTGQVSHFSEQEVMAAINEVNEERPSYLDYLSDEFPNMVDIKGEFRSQMGKLDYKMVEKEFPNFKMANVISMGNQQMNSHRTNCEKCQRPEQEEIKSSIAQLIRLQNPGGKLRKDAVTKMKDKISKMIIRLMYLGGDVELASKSGMMIKCGKDYKEIGSEFMGLFKQVTAGMLREMNVEDGVIEEITLTTDTVSEEIDLKGDLEDQTIDAAERFRGKINEVLGKIEELRKKHPEQLTNLEPNSLRKSFFGLVDIALKHIANGVKPCWHNRVVIDNSVCTEIRNKFSGLLNGGDKGKTMLKNRVDRVKKDNAIDFVTESETRMERLIMFFQSSEVACNSFRIKMNERLDSYRRAEPIEADAKISKASIDWLLKCLMKNKYFCASIMRSIIAETLSKAIQMKPGLTIRALTDDFNLWCDTVNYKENQMIFMVENRWTGKKSDAIKIDIKKLNSMELETSFLISLIASSLEQRNLFANGDSVGVENSNCDEWISFLVEKFKEIQTHYANGNAEGMIKGISEIRRKKIAEAKSKSNSMKVQEIISFYSYFVGPFISENNKSANSVVQMCRYFYSYNFSMRMNIKKLIKKLCVPIRGFASQQMASVATACYLYNINANETKRLEGGKKLRYDEKFTMKGMIDFFCNMEDITDSLQFCNAIYYVHASDRMEMDPRSPIEAYNMFCEKVLSWKSMTKESIEALCSDCFSDIKESKSFSFEDTTKACKKATESWKIKNSKIKASSRYRQCVLTDNMHRSLNCEECEDIWIRLECLYGYQLFRRRNDTHCKEVLKKKIWMINEENANFTFYCWEILNEAGYYTASKLSEGEVSKMVEKVSGLQINEMATTTNTKVSFPEDYDPIKSSNLVKKGVADKIASALAPGYKELEKRFKKEGKAFDAETISQELMGNQTGDSQFETVLLEKISDSVRKNFVELSRDESRSELYSFSQLCNEPRIMGLFMKEVYGSVKKSINRSSRDSTSKIMTKLKDRYKEETKIIRERHKCITAHDFFYALASELKKENSGVNKIRDDFSRVVRSCNAQVRVSEGMTMSFNGNDDGPSEESLTDFHNLFEKLMRLNKIRDENPTLIMTDDYSELYQEFVELRATHDQQLLKCFMNVVSKSFPLCMRWLIDRKLHSKLDSFVMESDAYVGPQVTDLTPMEWFVLNMSDKDYDLSAMFEMEPRSFDQLYQLKAIGVTTDQQRTYGDFIRTLDIATHSTVKAFERHKKNNFKKERLVSIRSEKAINAILDICKIKGISSLAQLCKLAVEDEKTHMRSGIAAKQQFGALRDLGVIGIDIRALQFYVEKCTSEIMTKMPNDMMNNIDRKKAFLDQVVQYYHDMEASNKFNCFAIAGDNSSWGQKMQNSSFLTCLSPLMRKDKTLESMFTNFCLKAMHKKIYINDAIAARCENALINNDLRWEKTTKGYCVVNKVGEVVNKKGLIENFNIPEEMANIIIDQMAVGKCQFETDAHMIQGICHKQSSLMHCCIQAYFINMMKKCYREDVTINMICSSDDYAVSYKFNSDRNDYDACLEDVERLRNIFTLSCNIANSPKTVISRCHFGEIYSFFVTPVTALQPTIKQVCAMVSAPIMPSPLDECYATFELSRMLFCSGGSTLTTNIGLLCRFLRNCSVKGESFHRSYKRLDNTNSFIPFINSPRFLSMSGIIGGLETTYCDRLRELMNEEVSRLTEGEILELACFAESSKISLYDDMSTKTKQISKTETIFGNPIEFKPTEAMMKLRNELRKVFMPVGDKFDLGGFIKDIISENQPAYDLDSTVNKLSQAFMSKSIIYNLVGTSTRDIKSFATMCYGGYYWEGQGFIDGPKLFFTKRVYMSVSNVNLWEVRNVNAVIEECRKSLGMISRRVSTNSKVLSELKQYIEVIDDNCKPRIEVKMMKKLVKIDEKNRLMINRIDDLICYLLDDRLTIENGSEIKLGMVDTDLRIIDKIDRSLRLGIKDCVEYDSEGMKVISMDNCVKIKKLVSSLRTFRNPRMEVVMQVSTSQNYETVQMMAMNKVMLNRTFFLQGARVPVISKMTENMRSIYNYMTVLNNLSPVEYDIQKSWKRLINESDIVQLMENEIFTSVDDVESQKLSGALVRLIGVINSDGQSRITKTESIRSVAIQDEADKTVLIDRYSVVSGDKSTRTEKYLIVTISENMIEASTNESRATAVANLIRQYCNKNAVDQRLKRPRSVVDFFSKYSKSTAGFRNNDIMLRFTIDNIFPADDGKDAIRIAFENLNTSDLGVRSMDKIAMETSAISQNRSVGLQVGYISNMPHEISDIDLLTMSMISKGFQEVASVLSKSIEGEFRGQVSIPDVADMSLEDLSHVMGYMVKKERAEARRDYRIPSSSNEQVTVPTINDALILGRSMELLRVEKVKDGFDATVNVQRGKFYSSLSSKMTRIIECVRSKLVRKYAIGIVTSLPERTIDVAIENPDVMDEIEGILNSATDADFDKLLSNMIPKKHRVRAGSNRIYYKMSNELMLDITEEGFVLAVKENDEKTGVKNTKEAMSIIIRKYPELDLNLSVEKVGKRGRKWTKLTGPAVNIDWAEAFVIGIGNSAESCRLMYESAAFFGGLTDELPKVSSKKSKKERPYGFYDDSSEGETEDDYDVYEEIETERDNYNKLRAYYNVMLRLPDSTFMMSESEINDEIKNALENDEDMMDHVESIQHLNGDLRNMYLEELKELKNSFTAYPDWKDENGGEKSKPDYTETIYEEDDEFEEEEREYSGIGNRYSLLG